MLQIYFINDINTMILHLFQSKNRQQKKIIKAGEYEECIHFYDLIYDACKRGYHDLIHFVIFNRNNCNWNHGLKGACKGGHIDLANLMILKGANNWNLGLSVAKRGGHINWWF